VTNTDRSTYGILDYLGDIGGLADLLYMLLGLFIIPFSTKRLNGLITNRLFYISAETEKHAKRIYNREPNSKKFRNRANGDLEVNVPKYLDWE